MNARKLANYYRAIADAQDALAACPKDPTEFYSEETKAAESFVAAGMSQEAAEKAVAENARQTADAQFRDAVVSARNLVLAGSGEKAELLGTLSTEPTADSKALEAAGLDAAAAAALLVKATELRAAALALQV